MRFGRFMLGFVPAAIALGVQTLAAWLCIEWAAMVLIGREHFIDSLYDLLTNTEFNAAIMLVYAVIIIVAFGFWYNKKLNGKLWVSPARYFHPMKLIAVIAIVPGAQFACNYIATAVSMLIPHSLEFYEDLLDSAGLDNSIGALMLLYAVIFAPIAEELIFRGMCMRYFRRACKFWLANLVQALLFGIFHMNLIQGCYAFALGLVLGYFCEFGGSIYYSILLHMLFNLWGTVIAPFISGISPILLVVIMLTTTAVSLAGGFVLMAFGRRRQKPCLEPAKPW